MDPRPPICGRGGETERAGKRERRQSEWTKGRKGKKEEEREREAIKVNALQEMPSQSERNSALHQHFTLTTLGLDVSLPEL